MSSGDIDYVTGMLATKTNTDLLTRTSPDESTMITIERIPKKIAARVTVIHLGSVVAVESCDVTHSSARTKIVKCCSLEIQQYVAQALMEIASQWGVSGTSGVPLLAEEKGRLTIDTDPWPGAVDAAQVLTALRAQIAHHVALPLYGDVVLALWIAHTHWIESLHCTPYLWLTSPTKQCGKTTVLELCQLLARRAWRVSNPSGAALFRVIELERPTLLLDEIDTVSGARLEDLTGILNDGFSSQGKVPRCVGDDNEVRTFSVFCAKAIAGIGTTLADATRSRCIRLPMARATGAALARLTSLRTDRAERWAAPLRSQLARLAIDSVDSIVERLREGHVVLPDGVDGRDAQVWEPLLVVAELAGAEWGAMAREACVALVKARRSDDDGDTKVRLLRDVRAYLTEHDADSVTSKDLIAWLIADESRGWADYRGKVLSAEALARLLKPFGVKPVKVREGESTPRVWLRSQLEPVFDQYLEPIAPE